VQARISNPVWIAQARTIAYWVTTLIIAVELAAGGVWDILQVPYVHDLVVQHLGYPAYQRIRLSAPALRHGGENWGAVRRRWYPTA
jgi:hypothetical protein